MKVGSVMKNNIEEKVMELNRKIENIVMKTTSYFGFGKKQDLNNYDRQLIEYYKEILNLIIEIAKQDGVKSLEIIDNKLKFDILFLLAAPCFAYFLRDNIFNLRAITGVYIIIVLVLFQLTKNVSGEELNSVLEDASRNIISVIVLINSVVLIILKNKQENRIIIWPSLISFIFSIIAIGRSGMICSFLLFIGVVFLYMRKWSFYKKMLFYSLFVFCGCVILFVFWTPISFCTEFRIL